MSEKKEDYGASHWSSDEVWNRRVRNRWLQSLIVPVTTNLLSAIAVHGALCLALRHPLFRGEGDQGHARSRALVIMFTKDLGEYLVRAGAMTPEQLKKAMQLEAQEGSADLG